MNGRVYDPEIGVFLSADPLVQFPHSTQGLNRYAYVGNNPLSYTDPSGHLIFSLIAAAIIMKAKAHIAWYAAMAIAAAGGYLDTGSLKAGILAGLSAGLAYGVGQYIGNQTFASAFSEAFARAATHGLVQGALGAAQGGKFGSAALAGFTSSILGPTADGGGYSLTNSQLGDVIQSAIVGGTASKIGGGKFANGAMTGAFVQALNHNHSASDAPGRELETFTAEEIVVRPEEVNDVYRAFFRQHKDIPLDQITIKDQAYAQALLVEGIRAGQSVGWVGSTAEALLFRKPTSFAQIGSRLARSLYVNRADAFGDVSLSDVQSARVSRSVAGRIALTQRSVYIHRIATGYFDDPNQSIRVP